MNHFHYYYVNILSRDLLLKKNYQSSFELPKMDKIILNSSSKYIVSDKKQFFPIALAFEMITGQKAQVTRAKKSVASFKLKEKNLIGCKGTLRQKKLYNFFEMYVRVILPRTKDFQKVRSESFDAKGQITLGFKNFLFFPDLEKNFEIFEFLSGCSITFITTASNKNEAKLLLSGFQLPFETIESASSSN